MKGAQRRALAQTVSVTDEGLASRDSLRSVGLTYIDVRTEVAAGRWRCHGKQTVALHCGPISVDATRWRALWETGVDVTALDGVTALQAAGLRGFDDDRIHVSVAHTARVKRMPGVVLHKVIRRLPTELAGAGIPRTTPAVAAVRAAGWSVSDRQAALVLLMTTQQRLATPGQMLEVTAMMPGRSRRGFIKTILLDAADGVQSLASWISLACVDAAGYPSRRDRPFAAGRGGGSTSTSAGTTASSSRSTGRSTGRAST